MRVKVRERRREQNVQADGAERRVRKREVELVGHLQAPELALADERDRGLDQRHLPREYAQGVQGNERGVSGPRECPGRLAVGREGGGGIPGITHDVGGGPRQKQRHDGAVSLFASTSSSSAFNRTVELRDCAQDQEQDVGAPKPLEERQRSGALREPGDDVERLEQRGGLAEA